MYKQLYVTLFVATNMANFIVLLLNCVKQKIINIIYPKMLEYIREFDSEIDVFVTIFQVGEIDVEMIDT